MLEVYIFSGVLLTITFLLVLHHEYGIGNALQSLCKLLTRHHFRKDISSPNQIWPFEYKCLICRDTFKDDKPLKWGKRAERQEKARKQRIRRIFPQTFCNNCDGDMVRTEGSEGSDKFWYYKCEKCGHEEPNILIARFKDGDWRRT